MFDVLLGYPSLKKSRMRRNIGINCLMELKEVMELHRAGDKVVN